MNPPHELSGNRQIIFFESSGSPSDRRMWYGFESSGNRPIFRQESSDLPPFGHG